MNFALIHFEWKRGGWRPRNSVGASEIRVPCIWAAFHFILVSETCSETCRQVGGQGAGRDFLLPPSSPHSPVQILPSDRRAGGTFSAEGGGGGLRWAGGGVTRGAVEEGLGSVVGLPRWIGERGEGLG